MWTVPGIKRSLRQSIPQGVSGLLRTGQGYESIERGTLNHRVWVYRDEAHAASFNDVGEEQVDGEYSLANHGPRPMLVLGSDYLSLNRPSELLPVLLSAVRLYSLSTALQHRSILSSQRFNFPLIIRNHKLCSME